MEKPERKPFKLAMGLYDFELDGVEYYKIPDGKCYVAYSKDFRIEDSHEILHMVYKNAQLEHRLNELEKKLDDIVHFNKLDDNSGF